MQKLFICIFLFVTSICTFYLDFTGSTNIGNLKEASPDGNSRNVLQEPWVMRNVWYQLANYSVRSFTNSSCVVCMKDAQPVAFTGVPGEVDPLTCTSYGICSNGSLNETMYLPEIAPVMASFLLRGNVNCTYHLCLTNCWLMRGSYSKGVDDKYRSEGDHYPWHTECPQLTSHIIPPLPYFKLARAQNTYIVCYESQPESANEFNRRALGSVPPGMCNVTIPVRWGRNST